MRQSMAILLCVCFVGCGESYRPTKREAPAQPVPDVSQSAPAIETATDAAGGVVELAAVRFTAPDTWISQPPRSQFVSAEFSLPRAEEDESDGRLTVSVAGGSVEANIDRWRGQFEGTLDRDTQEDLQIQGLTVKLVDCAGTFNDQPGPFAPGVTRDGYRMLAAIIPTSGQLHFVKAYGPQKTMAQHEAAFRAFVQSLELK